MTPEGYFRANDTNRLFWHRDAGLPSSPGPVPDKETDAASRTIALGTIKKALTTS